MPEDAIIVAVCGNEKELDGVLFSEAENVGRLVAGIPGSRLSYGAGPGYPGKAAAAFFTIAKDPRRVLAYSPRTGSAESGDVPSGVTVWYTDLDNRRNYLVVAPATHAVIFPGGWGTLSELCIALLNGVSVAAPAIFADELNKHLANRSIARSNMPNVIHKCFEWKKEHRKRNLSEFAELLVEQEGAGPKITPLSSDQSILDFLNQKPRCSPSEQTHNQ